MTSSRGKLLIAAGCLGLGAAAIAIGRPVTERPAASVLAAGPRVSVASRWRERVDTIHKGEPLSRVLERAGLDPKDAASALLASQSINARNIRAGTMITTRVNPDSGNSEIVFQLAIDRVVRLTRSAASAWSEKEERLPWTTDTVLIGGVVNSTLVNAIADGAASFPAAQRMELAYALAEVLEYRVDLSRDLQKGDSVRVLVERQQTPTGLVRTGNIIAARLTVDGKPIETMRFEQNSRVSYFDGEGKSMRAAFLRAPLAFRRISSLFGMRKHPILGIVRAHQGIDYAAASGTPVRALGNGRVIFAGWKGGYGRVVEIRHTNGYVTRYGHLSAFGSGIRAGAPVSISQTIGKVGASGLATAPHLHFEVLVGGKHRNPSQAFKNQTGEPLAPSQRAAFDALKARLLTALEGRSADAPRPVRVSGD